MIPTAKMIAALKWFAEREKACMFGRGDPSLSTVTKLADEGLIEPAGRETGQGAFGFVFYRISEAGRAALFEGKNPMIPGITSGSAIAND